MQLCIRCNLLCLCHYWELRGPVQICSESIHFVTRAEGVESFSGWRDAWKSGGVVATVDLGGGGVAREGTRAWTSGTVRWWGKPWSGLEDKLREQFNCLLKQGLLTLLTTRPRASPGSPSTCGTAYVHTSQHLKAVFGRFFLPIWAE